MRKLLWLCQLVFVFFLATSSTYLAADIARERFENANALYEEGKFDEALSLYHEIEKEVSHWKLYYNIGNCYFKTHDFIRAKIYYLRARRLKPFEPSIEKNIEIIDKRLSDKITADKPDFLSQLALRIESIVSINIVSILLLLAVLLLNYFIFILLKNGKSRGILYGVFFSLAAVLLVAGYHIHRTGKINNRNTAVIIKPDSQLRSGPGESNTILFKVNPGLKVKIIDSSRDWFQVSASSQVAGWIPKDRLEQI